MLLTKPLTKALMMLGSWLAATAAIRAAAAANHSSFECSTKCQLNDDTADCWKKAQKYFFHQFVKGINDFVAFEIMLKFWNERQGHLINSSNKDTLIKELLTDVTGPLGAEDFLSILEMLDNKTEKYSEDNDLEISCPTPCDYVNTLWIYLFVCACIVILLIIPVVFVHVHFNRRSFIKYQLS